MTVLKHPDQFLLKRGERWHYHRRVPGKFKTLDARTFVRVSLDTENRKIARMRRDALVEADDAYWMSLFLADVEGEGASEATRKASEKRYEAASARAMARGFAYLPAETLRDSGDFNGLMERIRLLERGTSAGQPPNAQDAEALLGAVPEPVQEEIADLTKVSEAFQLYLDEIAFDEQYNKSPKQKYSWEKTKRTSINYFIDVIGDLAMSEISREDALAYRTWWMERMIPREEGEKPAKPNTANRHIGNMRTLYEAYFAHKGDETRLNPFRKMFFKGESRVDVPPFENEWVRTRILKPGVFDELRGELVSANLMKAFRQRELFPSTDHVIYSFRHAFEKRMLEAGLDYGLRCTLMGHKTDRPAYGDGGSMEYRRDELMKIAHPVPEGLKYGE